MRLVFSCVTKKKLNIILKTLLLIMKTICHLRFFLIISVSHFDYYKIILFKRKLYIYNTY